MPGCAFESRSPWRGELMADKLHILQLERHDDAVSTRDRLAFVTARYVLLVWPSEGSVLRRKLDLRLVQRHAIRLGIRIALVTRDPVVIEHARDLEISVFPNAKAARRQRWKHPRDKAFIEPRDPYEQAALAEHVTRLREGPATPAGMRWRQAVRWTVFGALVLAILFGFVLVAPSARVTLTPASRQVYETVSITADPDLADVDIENFRMPAAVVTLQATSRVTIESSGVESAGASLAQGLVTLTNLADEPLVIPLGTVVATSDVFPIRFETLIETTLPAGEDVEVQVPVQALPEHAGAVGNVNPGAINRIEGNFGDVVSVTNPNATFGGAVQERATVTAQDHERLLVLGRQQVLQRARDTLLHQLSGEQFLVPGSVTIIQERPEWTIFNALVGDVAESVSLDLRAEVQAVVVDERHARQIAFAGIAPYIQRGQEVSPGALTFTRGAIEQIAPDGRVTFAMIVSGNIAESIDPDSVRSRIAGVSVSEARRRLQRELLLDPDSPPQIATWPAWYSRMPFLPIRINVSVATP